MFQLQTASAETIAEDRRREARESVFGDLWMVDHSGSTVLPCRCEDASPHGMRLRVPLGYGVVEGQRYELRSHLPGRRPERTFGLIGRRWATVVRTKIDLERDNSHIEVGVVFDPSNEPALIPALS